MLSEDEEDNGVFDDLDDKLFQPKIIDTNKQFSMNRKTMTEEEMAKMLAALDTNDTKKLN